MLVKFFSFWCKIYETNKYSTTSLDVNLRPSNDSIIPLPSNNQKEQGKENMADKENVHNWAPRKDLLSIELCEDGQIRDGRWFPWSQVGLISYIKT